MNVRMMAWRNIWRNRRRTLATTGAMILALLVTILYSAMVEGYLVNMERDSLDLELGAAQVHGEGYRDNPSIYTFIDDADEVVKRLASQGLAATPRLLGAGLVASGEASAGVVLRGIDVERDAKVLSVHEQIAKGKWLDERDPSGVVLGRKLAGTLGVETGGELIVLSQASDGSVANDLYKIRGVLRSVGAETDRAGLFLTADAYRELMVFPRGAHQIIVKKPFEMPLPAMATAVEAAAPGRDVKTWKQLVPILATMLESTRGMIFFVFLIIMLLAAIVILNTMLMAVFERIKEFGVLKAIGAGPGQVFRLILLETGFQVVVAIVVGIALSVPMLWYLSVVGIDMGAMAGMSAAGVAMMSEWRAVVNARVFAGPLSILLFVSLLAVLYPAMKAALIQPIKAMRHQ